MKPKESRKVHLRHSKIVGTKIIYPTYQGLSLGALCNTAHHGYEIYKWDEFKQYLIKYPKEVCQKCKERAFQMIREVKKKRSEV